MAKVELIVHTVDAAEFFRVRVVGDGEVELGAVYRGEETPIRLCAEDATALSCALQTAAVRSALANGRDGLDGNPISGRGRMKARYKGVKRTVQGGEKASAGRVRRDFQKDQRAARQAVRVNSRIGEAGRIANTRPFPLGARSS